MKKMKNLLAISFFVFCTTVSASTVMQNQEELQEESNSNRSQTSLPEVGANIVEWLKQIDALTTDQKQLMMETLATRAQTSATLPEAILLFAMLINKLLEFGQDQLPA